MTDKDKDNRELDELLDLIFPKEAKGRALSEADCIKRLNRLPSLEKVDFNTISSYLPENPLLVEDTYATSKGYLLTTGRRGMWAYKRNEGTYFVMLHPNIQDQILILPPPTGFSEFGLAQLAMTLPWPRMGIHVVRVNDKDAALLKEKSHQETAFVSVDEAVLDWKFPCHILNTEAVVERLAPDHSKLTQNIRRYAGRNVTLASITDDKLFKNTLRSWLVDQGHADFGGFYLHMYELSQLEGDVHALEFALDGMTAGYVFWDENRDNRTANYHGMIAVSEKMFKEMAEKRGETLPDSNYKFLSDFIMFKLCRYLDRVGFKELNLGGSETASLNQWKEKFVPARSYNLNTFMVLKPRLELYL